MSAAASIVNETTFQTHGPVVMNAAVLSVIMSPVIGFILCVLAACW